MIKVTFTDFSRGIYHKEVKLKQSTFPAGERYIKIEEDSLNELKADYYSKYSNIFVNVTALDATSDTIIDLILLSNCITNIDKGIQKILNFSYLPYGRQDRVCSPGESDSLRVFMNIISPLYDKISILDAHNNKFEYPQNVMLLSPEIDKYIPLLSSNTLFNILKEKSVIIAVDRGAIDRCKKIADTFAKEVIPFHKTRKDGKITQTLDISRTSVNSIIEDVEYLVVFDDICDGGGTFLSIANEIKKLDLGFKYKLILVVTHGIFSAGFDKLKEEFSEIYIYDSEFNKKHLS